MKKQEIWTPPIFYIIGFLMDKVNEGYHIVAVAPHYDVHDGLLGYLVIGEKEAA